MDQAARRERDLAVRELQTVVRELDTAAHELGDQKGIGVESCVLALSKASGRYKQLVTRLLNLS